MPMTTNDSDPETGTDTVNKEDEGERVSVLYDSRFSQSDQKTIVEGEIDEVQSNAEGTQTYVFVTTDDGRVLEIDHWGHVTVHNDAEGNYVDRTLGDDAELNVKRLYEVFVDATVIKHVRASDEDVAKKVAESNTDAGEMNITTDVNAATRIDESHPDHGDREVYDE